MEAQGRRRAVAAVLLALALALVVDLRQAPATQFSSRAAIGAIHLYQATLSPMYARMGLQCRFTLTCSHYGEECVRRFGVARGGWLAMKRVLRCGPWTPIGTIDPPPSS
jgi:putative membrane protein insertion efficiency factor